MTPFVPIAEFLLTLRQMGIMDRQILAAMESVPRALFLDGEGRHGPLFAERPQPIACGQTNTPPILIAVMLRALALTGRERILDVGTGSGYLAAVLSMMSRHVYTIERFRTLAEAARARFAAIRSDSITAVHGDGMHGWSERAPFDRIVTMASAPEPPRYLIDQLAPNGVMIMPIGPADGTQMLTRFQRVERNFQRSDICEVRFVPLIQGKAIRL
ncbi:protein-L-isoaspartate(D-aspartate) O-methyltransferase [Kaistia geumhonensis]|uniref:Protein-L-isoaspartate O-methyltransferase n=1 Tax=Kaistia geumhonensis TaxID=410839 RepID=A0ABU0M3E2_9HYPH|nr:protein-L-isoaspartate(D-aspartate) O-methyltransferase [Kaistia geumhonensis]MCX5479317.1 protein-L-isoaspartate(D-aspartate) O-methyltransferase [Kaistia geumhonensis]MDQ0515461.1 protein-L-isoaspartate(D-aspartate) O-methyltransferase [Kaistia geumhonensis]